MNVRILPRVLVGEKGTRMWQATNDAVRRRAFQPPQPPLYDERGVLAEPALLGASPVADGGALLDGELRAVEPAEGAPDDDPRRIYVALVRAEGTAAEARRRPTILYSHGNASDIGDMLAAARTLARRSGRDGLWCNVALYDYSGYGLSQFDAQRAAEDAAASGDVDSDGDGDGEPSLGLAVLQHGQDGGERVWEEQRRQRRRPYAGEAALLVDVERCKREAYAVYRHLVEDEHVPPASIVLWGTSIGSGPACALAAHLSSLDFGGSAAAPFGCLILQSPIYSVYSVVSNFLHHLPGDFFCNGDELAHVTRPVAIFHGTADQTVPYAHAQRLYAVLVDETKDVLPDAAARCRLWGVDGADHNDITAHRFWRDLAPVLRQFIAENTATELFTPSPDAARRSHHRDNDDDYVAASGGDACAVVAAAPQQPTPIVLPPALQQRQLPRPTQLPPPSTKRPSPTTTPSQPTDGAPASALLRRNKQFVH